MEGIWRRLVRTAYRVVQTGYQVVGDLGLLFAEAFGVAGTARECLAEDLWDEILSGQASGPRSKRRCSGDVWPSREINDRIKPHSAS